MRCSGRCAVPWRHACHERDDVTPHGGLAPRPLPERREGSLNAAQTDVDSLTLIADVSGSLNYVATIYGDLASVCANSTSCG